MDAVFTTSVYHIVHRSEGGGGVPMVGGIVVSVLGRHNQPRSSRLYEYSHLGPNGF